MKVTINAKTGYIVRKIRSHDLLSQYAVLIDGKQVIMLAKIRSMDEYNHEVTEGGNECARFCECFKTIHENTFIYWRDEETDEDFLTKVPQ